MELGAHFSSQRVDGVLWTHSSVAGQEQVMEEPSRTLSLGWCPQALTEVA